MCAASYAPAEHELLTNLRAICVFGDSGGANGARRMVGMGAASTHSRGMKRKHKARGFTLVEMSVTVVIVGILAMLATIGYRRLVTSSYLTEATRMVNAIRIAQETVRAETGVYVNLGLARMCPQNASAPASESARKYGWDPTCNSGSGPWSLLPVQTDGPVRYGYGTVANTTPAQAVSGAVTGFWNGQINGATVEWPTPAPQNWYVIAARGDMDGNGVSSYVVGSSFSNEVWIENDGE